MENANGSSGGGKVSYPVIYPIGALLFVGVCLALEHFDGGVVSHHLLNSSDMPAFSNWWGLLSLPLLGVLFANRAAATQSESRLLNAPTNMLAGFVGALIYGAMMATTFSMGAESLTGTLFMGLLLIALILPVYRVEYVFGFVVGMTYTFGGVLPVLVSIVFGSLSFVTRWVFRAVKARFTGKTNRT